MKEEELSRARRPPLVPFRGIPGSEALWEGCSPERSCPYAGTTRIRFKGSRQRQMASLSQPLYRGPPWMTGLSTVCHIPVKRGFGWRPKPAEVRLLQIFVAPDQFGGLAPGD